MKRFVVFLLTLALVSACVSTRPAATTPETNSKEFVKIPVTITGITRGAGPVKGPITRKVIEGSSVSLSNELTIAASSNVQTEVLHNPDGTTTIRTVVDGEFIHIPAGKGGVIVSAAYGNKPYPEELVVNIPSESGNGVNLRFVPSQGGVYSVWVDKENGQFVRTSDGYYRVTDPITKAHCWISSNVSLGYIFVDPQFEDRRRLQEGGVPLPE